MSRSIGVGVLLGLLAPALAPASTTLYLRHERLLTPSAPTSVEPRDDIRETVGDGQRRTLAEFVSEPAAEPLSATSAVAGLFLYTGRKGMENCAVVHLGIARRTDTGERQVLGSASLAASIIARRKTVDPIVLEMPLPGELLARRDRLVLRIEVENRCGSSKSPGLLYDGIDAESALILVDEREPEPTTTSTTTSTTSPPGVVTTTTTTTTTLPRAKGCLFEALSGYDAVFCRMDALAEVLADEDPADLGGPAVHARLTRRLSRARDLVAAAQSGRRPRRQLRRAVRSLAGFERVLRRAGRRSGIDPDLSEELGGLVGGALAEIGSLRRR